METVHTTRDRSRLYADGGGRAPSAVQITDRYHLISSLGKAMEQNLQQPRIDARRQLTQAVAHRPGESNKLTLIEAWSPRCRQANTSDS
jgi:hypothetical protein